MWNFEFCKSDIENQRYRPKTQQNPRSSPKNSETLSLCGFCLSGTTLYTVTVGGFRKRLGFRVISLLLDVRFTKFKVPHVAEDVYYLRKNYGSDPDTCRGARAPRTRPCPERPASKDQAHPTRPRSRRRCASVPDPILTKILLHIVHILSYMQNFEFCESPHEHQRYRPKKHIVLLIFLSPPLTYAEISFPRLGPTRAFSLPASDLRGDFVSPPRTYAHFFCPRLGPTRDGKKKSTKKNPALGPCLVLERGLFVCLLVQKAQDKSI